MKLETAIELINEAIKIENKYRKGQIEEYESKEGSMRVHDDCLRLARKVLLDNMHTRK